MSNISNIGDVYHWSIAKIAEADLLEMIRSITGITPPA